MRDPEYFMHGEFCSLHDDADCDCGAATGQRCICGDRNKCEACIERLIDNAEAAQEASEGR